MQQGVGWGRGVKAGKRLVEDSFWPRPRTEFEDVGLAERDDLQEGEGNGVARIAQVVVREDDVVAEARAGDA